MLYKCIYNDEDLKYNITLTKSTLNIYVYNKAIPVNEEVWSVQLYVSKFVSALLKVGE